MRRTCSNGRGSRPNSCGSVALRTSISITPAELFPECYATARNLAARETGIDFTLFPAQPPFTVEQAMNIEFLPEEPDLLDQS